MAKTLWQSDVLFALRINCLHQWRESGVEWIEIHSIIRLTTSFGGVLGTMAGVEQYQTSNPTFIMNNNICFIEYEFLPNLPTLLIFSLQGYLSPLQTFRDIHVSWEIFYVPMSMKSSNSPLLIFSPVQFCQKMPWPSNLLGQKQDKYKVYTFLNLF